MFERRLGVELAILVDATRAAENAQKAFRSIVTGIDEVKAAGRFDLPGIQNLQAQIGGLASRVQTAAKTVREMGDETAKAGRKTRVAADDFKAAATASADLTATLHGVSNAIVLVGSNILNTGSNFRRVAPDIAVVRNEFRLLTDEAVRARAAVDALDRSFRQLTTSQQPMLALNRAQPHSPIYQPGGFYPPPGQRALPSEGSYFGQRALPPGYYPRQPQLALTGGVDPNYNRSSGGGGGNEPPHGGGSTFGPQQPWDPQWGKAAIGAGQKTMRFGNAMQGAGYAGTVNFALTASVFGSMIKHAMDLDDILHLTGEALAHAGATPKAAKIFADRIMQMSTTIGGDFRQNISGMYPFVSSAPVKQAGLDLNNTKDRETMARVYGLIMKLHVADASSITPESMYNMVLTTAATAHNLGYKMTNAQEFEHAMKGAANALVQMKNKTGSTAAQAGTSFRQVGQLAANAGMSADEIVGISAILADSKLLGSINGNNIKRLMQRQATDPKALQALQDAVSKATHGQYNLSMFDDKGHMKGMYDLIGQIVDVQKYHMDPKDSKGRMKMDTLIAGLYATPGLSSLVQFGFDNKGGHEGDAKKFLKKFGESIVHDKPQGALPNETPLDTTVRVRQSGNIKSDVQKTDAAYNISLLHTFELMKPEMQGVLHNINLLIMGWEKLNPGVKQGILHWGGLFVLFSGGAGIMGILLGNFIKLGGAIGTIVGGGIRLTEMFMALEKGAIAAAAISKLQGAFAALRVGIAAAAAPLAAFVIPAAIIGAIALLAVAWKNDWGNIRENTAKTTHEIEQNIKKLSGIDIGSDPIKKWAQGITKDDPIKKWVLGLIAYFNTDPLGHAIGSKLNDLSKLLENWGKGAAEFGTKFATDFVKNIGSQLQAGKEVVKSGLKLISDLFGHSLPPDNSSPLTKIHDGSSSRALVNDWIDPIILGLGHGAKKIKHHALKPIADEFIILKNETVSQVVDMAKRVEAALVASGAVIKRHWIQLFDPATMKSTRVYGDAQAYRLAARTERDPHKDTSVVDAAIFAEHARQRAKLFPEMTTPEDLEETSNALRKNFHALTAVGTLAILKMADSFDATAKKMRTQNAKNLAKQFVDPDKDVKAIETDFTHADQGSAKFDTVQRQEEVRLANKIQMQKSEKATENEMAVQRNIEIDEKNKLNAIMVQEIKYRDDIQKRLNNLNNEIKAITATDQASQDKKAALQLQAEQYDSKLTDLNNTLDTQTATIKKLDQAIDEYGNKISEVKAKVVTFADYLDTAFNKAVKSASDTLGKEVGGAVDHFVEKILGKSGKQGSLIQSVVGDFVKTFVRSIVSQLMDGILKESENGLATFFQRLLGRLGKGSSSGSSGGGIINALTSVFGGNSSSSSGSSPIPVSLTGQSGSTDVGTKIAEGIGATAALLKAVSPTSTGSVPGSSGGNGIDMSLPGTDANGNLIQNKVGKSISAVNKVMGALAVIDGVIKTGQEGGSFSNGLQMGLGAFQATGNPIVAGAAFLYGTFAGPHWGPASNYPDRGPGAAEYQAWLKSYNGGPGDGGDQLQGFINALSPAAYAALTPAQQKEVNDIRALNPGNTPGGLGISNEHDGIFKFGGGGSMSVAQFQQESADLLTLSQQSMNSLLAQQESADRLAASFTTMMINGPAGFTMPELIGGSVAAGSLADHMEGPNNFKWRGPGIDMPPIRGLQPLSPAPSGGDVTIRILEGATVGNADQVVQAIQDNLPLITSAVQRARYDRMRLSGDYISETS